MADESLDLLNGKPLSECSKEEVIEAINKLRQRRIVARERRATERSAAESGNRVRKATNEITGSLGSTLDDIFKDDSGPCCAKCGTPLQDDVCPNLSCE